MIDDSRHVICEQHLIGPVRLTQAVSRRSVSPARWMVIVVALLAGGGVLGWFGAWVRAPVGTTRTLSLEIGAPAGGELIPPAQSTGDFVRSQPRAAC